ncbi:protein NLRC3-like isoform X3 [Onychostoma macrolepis]|uniref:protein NLRC3-like isoform X3 n=1 Tax=Onychostoma macrolepis TaxID=369639 RepID=UPI00272D18C1|nr:protein NLRC3-like isoform X3 [Onychostoma macrolepis]
MQLSSSEEIISRVLLCVCESMDRPIMFNSGDSSGLSSAHQKRLYPDSSCVSVRSGASMEQPMSFNSGHSSAHQKRLYPDSSCVSVRSGASMEQPMSFNSGHSSAHQKRLYPDSSCVSVRSGASMEQPISFNSGLSRPVHQKRSEPDSIRVSVKSHTSTVRRRHFKTRDTRPGLSHDVFSAFRSNLKRKFGRLYEGTATQRNPTLLNEIYTELYITESESGEISNEHEVRQIETQSRRAATEDMAIKCNHIFRPLPGQDKAIRTVLTKGVAGIGKTVSVQKFILDWAEGNENQDVQLIFPLPFREINLMKDKTLSLSDLLHVFFPETKEMEISSDEYKVLFIFDGLDECRLSLDFQSDVRLCDVSESASVDVLLMNLIVGNLLPSALIWITSRPAAADLVPSECVHRVTEVRGFNEPQKEEYFRKRISDQSLADKIISHLKSSRSLYIMCHIPVFCWISAAVLEKMLSPAETGEIPKTLTQMYTRFLILQTNIKREKDYEKKVTDEDMILKLGKLALQQLVKGNLIFYEEDLRECGIDVAEASVYSGLCTQIFREELGLYQGKVFCFVHLSIQEHLAALYAHKSFIINNIIDQTKESLFSVSNWMKSLSKLHQRVVDEALQSKNGHLDLFLRFLLGLSVESNQTLLQKLLTLTGSCSYNKKNTVQYIKQKIRENHSPEKSINLFHCLNELGDDSLMQEIQHYLISGKIRKAKLSSSQWSALVYVLLTSEQKMDVFDLKHFIGAQHTADEVLQNLLPVVKESRSVRLSGCMVTEEGCSYVSSALSSNSSHLRELDLSYNHPGDSGVKLLSEKLEGPNCSLDKLNVDHGGEIRITAGLNKFACFLTLDPNTAHTELLLSEENREVTRVREKQPYPDHPDRFDYYQQVLCRESVCGRCYWELEWSGDHVVEISVSYKSISRKGSGNECVFGYNDQSWSLFCTPSRYLFIHNNIKTVLPVKSIISRIGVYVDHSAGTLSFFSVSDTMSLIHTVQTTFTQPLYPGFGVYKGSSVKLCR